jgi:hypothetical protein
MTIPQICLYMVMASGILLLTGGVLQAQLGGGSSSGSPGGAIGQGGPDITRPGGDAMRGGWEKIFRVDRVANPKQAGNRLWVDGAQDPTPVRRTLA